MKLRELFENTGRIVKGVNTTPDVGVDQVSKEAAKFGFKVDKDGVPPTLSKKVKGKSTNVLFNLGLTESVSKDELKKQLAMGVKVEMEHTDDPKEALKIAMDHLREDPLYYNKLKFIESSNLSEGLTSALIKWFVDKGAKFTDDQVKQIEKIHSKYNWNKNQIDKLEAEMRVEYVPGNPHAKIRKHQAEIDRAKQDIIKIAKEAGTHLKENFADGKKKGKSRPGRVKKAGASCKGSVTSLRKKAAKYSGEKGKMYHWCANMKGGKK